MDSAAALAHARTVASGIAADAGDMALGWYHRGVEAEEKRSRDLVSEADRAVERYIVARLTEAFPEDSVVGEEGSSHDVPGSRRWYVDPIDGTTNFLKGLPDWGVSIGLAGPADELLVGVIAMPRHGTVHSAAIGQGVTRNGVPISGSTEGRLDRVLVAHAQTRTGGDHWGGIDKLRRGYVEVATRSLGTRMQGCSVADLTRVAEGVIDATWAGGMSKWDVAAGLVLLLEAGVMVTDPAGAPVTTVATAFLASPPAAHAELRALIDGA